MLNELLLVISPILILIIGWLSKRTLNTIEETQKEILEQVRETNGRVIALESDAMGHNKLDDTRFKDVNRRFDELLDK